MMAIIKPMIKIQKKTSTANAASRSARIFSPAPVPAGDFAGGISAANNSAKKIPTNKNGKNGNPHTNGPKGVIQTPPAQVRKKQQNEEKQKIRTPSVPDY